MYKIIKTHAKSLGTGLYIAGEVYTELEDAAYKIKKGLAKQLKKKIKTKEEKVVKVTKRRGRPSRK